ncbi:type IV-A pilus assembly ATPase PilB [Halomonas sp. M20]|uniref:type IV-A pilus assembly ATPase PilB n=1 Tax=Halomonas sp. M20 TaxID=2763264 RepID=UPI001D0B627D|nr:type IV-A pilus assembly ATPase PilB [Halomonas sp. M20]
MTTSHQPPFSSPHSFSHANGEREPISSNGLSSPFGSQHGAEGLQGFAKRLVDDGLLAPDTAHYAEQQANESDISLLQYVIEHDLLAARDATLAAGREYGLPVVDLDALPITALPSPSEMPERILRKYQIMPLKRTAYHITVAVPFPSTLALLDELQFATGLNVEAVLASIDQLIPALESYLSQAESENTMEALADEGSRMVLDEEAPESRENTAATSSDDAPVIKFVNKILQDAIQRGASDIHVESYESSFRIRFRIDGILLEVSQPPFNLRTRIAARIKVMARLDISERRLPQDGAIKLKLPNGKSIDFRVNTLPTVYGEKIVLRILDPSSAQLGIDALGFTPTQKSIYERALAQPQGMILVTGPTGSGKTVTLYTGLNILNTIERNISTAEDPVEIKVAGVNQVNIHPKIGLDFASALRAFLRQDPDVIMVGEIRDLETAEISIKAAQTGHLVLSTVHTNSVAETLIRLNNMGVASFNIASSISLIIAQRLARKLCPHCKRAAKIPHDVLIKEGLTEDELNGTTIYQPGECRHCTLGYKGRVGIYEVVPISNEMRHLIMQQGNSLELDALARQEGYADLRRSGLQKVLEGVTSLEEINRVTKD